MWCRPATEKLAEFLTPQLPGRSGIEFPATLGKSFIFRGNAPFRTYHYIEDAGADGWRRIVDGSESIAC
jgi:hypothetical protein